MRAVRAGDISVITNFIDNGDGTVTDTETGLMWQQDEAYMNWESALSYCENLELAGYNDWRLPNINELQSLVDYSTYNPAIDTYAFPHAISYSSVWRSTFRSSTTNSKWPEWLWCINFGNGNVSEGCEKWHGGYVRAVRGGHSNKQLRIDHIINIAK